MNTQHLDDMLDLLEELKRDYNLTEEDAAAFVADMESKPF